MHTLVCDRCHISQPDYFRRQAEHAAISAALLRQAFMGVDVVGGIRWSEQQYRDFVRKSQQPPPRDAKTPKELPVAITDHRTVAFELPLLPTRNNTDRMHFRAKRKMLDSIGAAFGSQMPPEWLARTPFPRARIEIVRMSSVEPDPDALNGSVKYILDAMQPRTEKREYGIGIISGDSAKEIELVPTRWQRAAPRRGRVIVLVTPL